MGLVLICLTLRTWIGQRATWYMPFPWLSYTLVGEYCDRVTHASHGCYLPRPGCQDLTSPVFSVECIKTESKVLTALLAYSHTDI